MTLPFALAVLRLWASAVTAHSGWTSRKPLMHFSSNYQNYQKRLSGGKYPSDRRGWKCGSQGRLGTGEIPNSLLLSSSPESSKWVALFENARAVGFREGTIFNVPERVISSEGGEEEKSQGGRRPGRAVLPALEVVLLSLHGMIFGISVALTAHHWGCSLSGKS